MKLERTIIMGLMVCFTSACNATLSLDGTQPERSSGVNEEASEPSTEIEKTASADATSPETPALKKALAVSEVQIIPERLVIEANKSSSATGSVRYADNTVDSNLIWSSSDNTIASVDPDSGQVTGLKAGEVTIIASASRDNNKRAALQVSVRSSANDAALITLQPEELLLTVGSTGSLKATVRFADGRESSNLSWRVSDTSVAVIKSNGSNVTVTGVGKGTTIITASSDDAPSKTVSAKITVE